MITIGGHRLPDHISHSQMTTWLDCGWAYFLGKSIGVKEIPSWWLIGGSAVHEATEAYDKTEWELNKL